MRDSSFATRYIIAPPKKAPCVSDSIHYVNDSYYELYLRIYIGERDIYASGEARGT
jgi:hypothetical protein